MNGREEAEADRLKGERFDTYTRDELIQSGLLTITVEEAARFLGIGRGAAYECARNRELPVLPLGRKRLVPVPALLRMLGEHE